MILICILFFLIPFLWYYLIVEFSYLVWEELCS